MNQQALPFPLPHLLSTLTGPIYGVISLTIQRSIYTLINRGGYFLLAILARCLDSMLMLSFIHDMQQRGKTLLEE